MSRFSLSRLGIKILFPDVQLSEHPAGRCWMTCLYLGTLRPKGFSYRTECRGNGPQCCPSSPRGGQAASCRVLLHPPEVGRLHPVGFSLVLRFPVTFYSERFHFFTLKNREVPFFTPTSEKVGISETRENPIGLRPAESAFLTRSWS